MKESILFLVNQIHYHAPSLMQQITRLFEIEGFKHGGELETILFDGIEPELFDRGTDNKASGSGL